MQFQLTLTPFPGSSLLPANYQYPLSAAIYKIIQQADEQYAAFLHDKGYQLNGKSFKLFCFSDLRVPVHNQGDRLLIDGATAHLTISFHIDEAASHFIKGLFINQQLDIGDKKSRVRFLVRQVEMLPDPVAAIPDEEPEVVLQPLSPIVAGRKNSRGHYDFLGPADEGFVEALVYNWLEKYKAVYGDSDMDIEGLKKRIEIIGLIPAPEIKSRLITIKAFTPEQTQIRGFTKFRMRVRAPKLVLQLALDAGLGLYNAQGMGCVGVVTSVSLKNKINEPQKGALTIKKKVEL